MTRAEKEESDRRRVPWQSGRPVPERSTSRSTPHVRSAAAVGALFFTNGAVLANWLPRLPELRERLGVSDAGLGASLLGGGLGGLLGSLVIARVMDRFPTRRVVSVTAFVLALLVPLISVVSTPFLFAALLTVFGFVDVGTDMSMNAQGVAVQKNMGRSIMQRLHGGWSLGFLAGAVLGSLASATRVSMRVHLSAVAVVLIVVVLMARPYLVDDPEPEEHHRENGSKGAGLGVAAIAMAITAIAFSWVESAANDWSSIAMRDLHDLGRFSGFATVTFALAMTVGRLFGDHVSDQIGAQALLQRALVLTILGLGVMVLAPNAFVAFAALVMWGLGVSVLFPQLYADAASIPGVRPGAGLAAMGIGQRFGFMVSPLLIGRISDWRSLRWSFAAIAIAVVVLTSTGRSMKRRAQERSVAVDGVPL